MQCKIITFLFFYGWITTTLVIAQTPFSINFDTKDGLPSSETYNIHFSKDNRAWFTTDRGVAVYNGYDFMSYSTKHGLSNNTNFTIYEDSKERLWFTGFDGSLSIFEDGDFVPYPLIDTLFNFAKKGFYNSPLEDEAGNLIFFNRYFNFIESSFTRVNLEENSFEVLSVDELCTQYPVLKGLDVTLLMLEDKAIPFSETFDFRALFYKCKDGWVGADTEKVFKYDEKGNRISEIAIKNGMVVFCYVDEAQDLWVGTSNGLLFFENGEIENKPQCYFANHSITDLKVDFEGNYWISTIERGVYFVPYFKMNVVSFLEASANHGRILSIAALKHRIYFGSSRQNILSVDRHLKQELIPIPNKTHFGSLNHITKKDDQVYFRHYNLKELEDTRYVLSKNAPLERGLIVKKLKNDAVFISSSDLIRLGLPDGKTILPEVAGAPFRGRVESIEEDLAGNIWIGTQKGVYKIAWDNYQTIIPMFTQYSSLKGRINDIKIDTLKHLWIASIGQGLIYKTADSLYQITIEDGLHSNLINCVYLEDEQTVWIGTNQGLNRLTYQFSEAGFELLDIQKYGVLDGLLSNFINDIEIWNDYLWLATNKGIAYIKPQDLKKRYPKVPISLARIAVNEKTREVSERLQLKPQENDLLFQLMGISYRKSEIDNFYRYRLYEKEQATAWVYTNDRNVRFFDVAPGNYTFEAMAKNKSGEWSDDPVQLALEIKPYFTQTILFKCTAGGTLTIIFTMLFLFRDWQLKRRGLLQQRVLELEFQSKEYELSALRNQMNPHFVFNSLNAIQNFIFKNDSRKANYYLSKFSKLMRDSLRFSRLKYISLHEELEFLRAYLELEQMRFPERFEYSMEVEEYIPLRQYEIPALLFQPILENAIKHAFKDIKHKGLLKIEIRELLQGKKLAVRIEDNGMGFDGDFFDSQAMRHKSLGLTIVRNQVELLNTGDADVQADFQIYNLKEINTSWSGVRVDFVVPVRSLFRPNKAIEKMNVI